MNESLVSKSSLALAGIHPVKRRVAAAAAVAASAWPLPAPRCMPAVGRLPTVWPPGPDFIQERILLPRRHVPPPPHTAAATVTTPTCCRRRVTELPPLLLLCTRRACGALEGSSTTQLSFFWSFGKLLLPPKQ